MSETYKLKEVHIQIQDGVTLIAEVSSVAAVRALLDELGGGEIKVIKHKATLKPPQNNMRKKTRILRPHDLKVRLNLRVGVWAQERFLPLRMMFQSC